MRFLKADFIYPISSVPVKNGILIVNENGSISDVLDPVINREDYQQVLNSGNDVETFRGILCPGFINAHCHLELSHLKGKLREKQKLPAFLRQVSTMRQAGEDEIIEALYEADAEMVANGIVAVGDISNTDHSFSVKGNSKIHYHTFIELFDFHPNRAEDVFDKGKQLYNSLTSIGLAGSIVPHAPYTVSPKLLKLLNNFSYDDGAPLCIHNQETESENAMFLNKSGDLFTFLQNATSLYTDWKATGFSSLSSTLVHLPNCNKIQLVHNTYSTAEDINWAQLYSMLIWWCFCPNASFFIATRLPDNPLFIDHASKITLRTDRYASNWSLSIFDEIKRVNQSYPEISLEILLTWATLNGAQYLGLQNKLGSFEKGKIPGVNWITNIDVETLHLSGMSEVVPLC